jgi:hypothetical protein
MRVFLVAATAFTLLLGPTAGSSAASTNPFAGMSAKRVLSITLAAAAAEHAVQSVTRTSTTSPQMAFTLTGTAEPSAGVQSVTGTYAGASLQVKVIVIGDRVYLLGNRTGLMDPDFVGMSAGAATKYAGRWVYGAVSKNPFSSAAKNVTYSPELFQGLLYAPLTLGPVTSVDGKDVVGIHGLLASGGEGVGTDGWLYVSLSGKHLPVRYGGTATGGQNKVTSWTDFSNWNETVTLVAPKGAVAYQ